MLKIQQERSYSESCLPKTIELAIQNKAKILSFLGEENKGWPFEDRVLVWLVPSFYSDVHKYHRETGPNMTAIFKPHHIEHFDSDFREKLAMRLEVVRSTEKTKKKTSARILHCPHCQQELSEISSYLSLLRMEYDQLWDRITALEKDRSRSVSKKAIFVASKFRKYFHKPQCDWMRHVPANNLMTFASRDEAFEAGLKPCKTCRA